MDTPSFNMFIRGKEYAIEGFIEGADPSVGFFGAAFLYDRLVSVEDGVEASQAFYDSLTDSEQLGIDCAYWDSQIETRLYTYSWREAELEAYYLTERWPEDVE